LSTNASRIGPNSLQHDIRRFVVDERPPPSDLPIAAEQCVDRLGCCKLALVGPPHPQLTVDFIDRNLDIATVSDDEPNASTGP
jgi:hypothetical protein